MKITGGSASGLKRSAVIIVGMHRSGTSCLAGSLEQSGLYLGKVFEWSPHNRKGNRENEDIMLLNESILTMSAGSWSKPPAGIRWTADQAKLRDEIINDINSIHGRKWGFKDPRAIFTLPFWEDGLDTVELVGTFRHPLSVAYSLQARNNISIRNGLELWYVYNEALLAHLLKYNFPIACFDVSQDEYISTIRHITKRLEIENPTTFPDDVFYDISLISHQAQGHEEFIPKHVLHLYGTLRDIYLGQKTYYD